MKKQLSDEQIDKLMRSFIDSTAGSDLDIDDVVSSPKLWWSVQREIAVQKAAVASPWPSSFNWLRLIGFAVPLLLLTVVAIGFLNPDSAIEPTETAGMQKNGELPVSDIATVPHSEPVAPKLVNKPISIKKVVVIPFSKRLNVRAQTDVEQTTAKTQRKPVISDDEEVRSDFIALSYAQNPSSGQIVRVKVPSSMKVTLGVVDRVDKPSELVDAEVVVGDHGMTHAIRFIRQ